MKKTLLLLSLVLPLLLQAQLEDNRKPKSGMMFTATTSLDMPLADMADRFGNSFTLGGGFLYKSRKNTFAQVFCEFIMGSNVKQVDMYRNVGYSDLQLYDYNGNLRDLQLSELGLNIGIGVGKTILLNPSKSLDNGINFMTSLSLLQHRINHDDPDRVLIQAIGPYAKGYDYLTNGLCINQSIQYIHFSRKSLANFSAGINARFGFTKNRRSINYATGLQDDRLRTDILIGLQLKWIIPLFKNVESDVYF